MSGKFSTLLLNVGILPLRIALGVIFFAHGAQKVLGWFGGSGLKATIDGFQTHLGIPAVLAVIAALTELLGGLFVILGLFTRWASLGLSIVMIVAIFLVHLKYGFFMNWFNKPDTGHGIEYNVALLGMSLTLLLLGPGKLSIDSFC